MHEQTSDDDPVCYEWENRAKATGDRWEVGGRAEAGRYSRARVGRIWSAWSHESRPTESETHDEARRTSVRDSEAGILADEPRCHFENKAKVKPPLLGRFQKCLRKAHSTRLISRLQPPLLLLDNGGRKPPILPTWEPLGHRQWVRIPEITTPGDSAPAA